MARLDLKLDGTVLRDYPLANTAVTIGRLADNEIHIDDLSVSGHHAKVVLEDAHYVVYDEQSTNGLYVNGQKVNRAILGNEDTILIGRHILAFEDAKLETVPEPVPVKPVATPTPATIGAVANPVPVKITSPIDKHKIGVITVMGGKTDQREYVLTGDEIVIGKSEVATIRLQRWFAPKLATTIHHRGDRYYIRESQTPTPVRINSEVVQGERQLEPGDTILVDDVTLQFDLQR